LEENTSRVSEFHAQFAQKCSFFYIINHDYGEKRLIIRELITRERSFLIHGNKKQVKNESLPHDFSEMKKAANADVHMKIFSGKMKFLRKQGGSYEYFLKSELP